MRGGLQEAFAGDVEVGDGVAAARGKAEEDGFAGGADSDGDEEDYLDGKEEDDFHDGAIPEDPLSGPVHDPEEAGDEVEGAGEDVPADGWPESLEFGAQEEQISAGPAEGDPDGQGHEGDGKGWQEQEVCGEAVAMEAGYVGLDDDDIEGGDDDKDLADAAEGGDLRDVDGAAEEADEEERDLRLEGGEDDGGGGGDDVAEEFAVRGGVFLRGPEEMFAGGAADEPAVEGDVECAEEGGGPSVECAGAK